MSLEACKYSLTRYSEEKVPTGKFLRFVLENKLAEALRATDPENATILPELCSWIWFELPANIWGSPQKVRAHLGEAPLTEEEGDHRKLQALAKQLDVSKEVIEKLDIFELIQHVRSYALRANPHDGPGKAKKFLEANRLGKLLTS